MRRLLRWLAIACAAVIFLCVLGAGALWAISARKLRERHPVPGEPPLVLPSDSATIEHGRHLATAVATCVLCHGEDLGGAVYADEGPLGIIAGPNLTSGRGGVAASLEPEDWEHAIRHGTRRDGTSLIVMPSEVYVHMSDEDLAAIVAYLRQAPPVDREVPKTRFGPLGRVLLAAGKLPLMTAAKTPAIAHPTTPPASDTVAFGHYLADISGCHGCHGYGLSGGRVAGPPDLPPASNLTPAGLGGWSEADFRRVFREGKRPGDAPIHEFMPWRVLGRMSDGELHAVWLYLRSVPERPFGNK